MRISDWSSDVCSSDLHVQMQLGGCFGHQQAEQHAGHAAVAGVETHGIGQSEKGGAGFFQVFEAPVRHGNMMPQCCRAKAFARNQALEDLRARPEEHTSELQSLMRISYAVFCLNKKKQRKYRTCT